MCILFFILYNYNIMITPNIWGPHFWIFFHLITSKYPNNPSNLDKIMAFELINSIKHILPCKKCSRHYIENIKNFPLNDEDINSKCNFITWFINFHNIVNISLNKSISTINNINNFKHIDYWYQFKRVINYIEDDIDDDINFTKCQGIKKFIKVGLYFGGKKYENYNIDFHNYKTFLVMKKKIFI